ncbi:MAG: hypothetical protein WCA28_14545 [Bradyrhizobium sp.]
MPAVNADMFSKRLQWQRFESPLINVAPLASASGTINIGAAPGNTPVAPGTLNTAGIVFGAGTGGINFNHAS